MTATEWTVLALTLFVKLAPSLVALAIGMAKEPRPGYRMMSCKLRSKWFDAEYQKVSDDRQKV